MKVSLLVLAVLLAAINSFPAYSNPPVSSMERKLQHIEKNGTLARPDPAPTELTEQEINAYFAAGKIKLPDGVQSLRLVGESGVVTATSRVDFDQIQAGRRSSNPLLSIFSGTHDVEVEAHAHGAGGRGIVHIDSVALDGIEIPRFILQLFVEKYLQPKHPELGLDSRFPLPDKIDTATIGPHKLMVMQK